MAEALLSKEHFYLNASQYNSGTVDEEATIHVQDNTDILKNSSDWLVHITRFSCDTMKSLTYVEKDDTARWEIRVVDDYAKIHEIFNFVLDDDYATPQALVAGMNLHGRWITRRNIEYEVFRWQIDANGKFKLTSMSEEAISGSHITYVGSTSMNKLLGLQKITPFISYRKSPSLVYAEFADWMYNSCISRYSEDSLSYRLHRLTLKTVVHYLNGFQCHHYNAAKTMVYLSTPTHMGQDIEHQTLSIVDKGLARTSSNNSGEAILPKSGSPMLCEWFAEYHSETNFDTGFKAATSKIKYPNVYSPTTGRVEFYDLLNGNKMTPCAYPQFWPIHEGKSYSSIAFKATSTFVPLDSLFGYVFSGVGNVNDASGSFVISGLGMPGSDPRHFHFSNAMEEYTIIGDDVWVEESYIMEGGPENIPNWENPPAYSTHQIEWISENRKEVIVDMPMGSRTKLSVQFVAADAFVTNRRIPFQSRSMQWWGVQQLANIQYGSADCVSIILNQSTNGTAGDYVVFINPTGARVNTLGDLYIVRRNWHPQGPHINASNVVNAVEELIILGTMGSDLTNLGSNWHLANQWTNYRLMIIKTTGDRVRWGIDRTNLKLSSTTFSYDGIQYVGAQREPQIDIQGLAYLPERYQQVYNKSMLERQIENTLEIIESEHIFRAFDRPCATTTITEKLTNELIGELDFSWMVNRRGRMLETLWGPAVWETTHSVTHQHGGGSMAHHVLPNPWWTHTAWNYGMTGEKAFLENHQYDKPHLQLQRAVRWRTHALSATNTVQYFHEDQYGSGGTGNSSSALVWSDGAIGYLPMSPIICGIRNDIMERESYVIWSPKQAIGDSTKSETMIGVMRHENLMLNESTPATMSIFAATYDYSTRGYQLARKEMNVVELVNAANISAKIYGADGDYIASEIPSQIDLVFPFKQLVLTSDDLNQLPEKTQDTGGMKPILSSYTLPSMWPISVDKEGQPAGGESTPFGTVYFTETGARRFHHLTPVPGGLRQFTINAVLTYKDDKRAVKRVQLPPGGSFNAQLLFIRKVSE